MRWLVERLAAGRLRRLVQKALALTPRGFVAHDVPILTRLSARLEVEWCARDVHPWDRDLPPERHAELFREQTLHDTDAAIARFFEVLPDLETVAIRVREPGPPNRVVLAGAVERHEASVTRSLQSPRMRLEMMGIRCVVRAGRLEPLD